MTFDEFEIIISQIKNRVTEILLWNYGEPFLNKDLLKMIKCASSANIDVITSTNGQFFKSEKFCMDIVKSGLKHLIICLDGADQDTLSKFRGKADYNDIINGIKFIIAAKKKLSSKIPIVELQFIVMKHNEHQREIMKQIAKQLSVDVYCEKTVVIYFNDPDFQHLSKELVPTDISSSRYTLKQDGTFELKGGIPNNCHIIDFQATINSDGTVLPCCYDLYSSYIMGNIFTENLKIIWMNKKYRDFRKRIRTDRRSIPICNICSEGRYKTSKSVSI
jgi:Predicted Fe-S oxidoreductases